jgi:hypothetical protein
MARDEPLDGTAVPLDPTVLAIDPGREKNGLAVVRAGSILARAIVSPEALVSQVCAWRDDYRPSHLLIGSGTGHRAVLTRLTAAGLIAEVVPETDTTRRARARYFQDHPPIGWRRLMPRGLLVPPVPIDDYAACLIAEDFLESRG